MTTLVNPIMFGGIRVSVVPNAFSLQKLTQTQSRTYFLFAGLNLLWIPIVFLCKQNFGQALLHARPNQAGSLS